MAITMDQVKELRDRTGAPIIECKQVLEQANGDVNQALGLLRERGAKIGEKKAAREAKEGRIEVYVHPGNRVVGVVELNCETDFVARNDDFIQLAKDIALQVVGLNPRYIRKEDVPEEALQDPAVGSPEQFYQENVLLEQPFVRDSSVTIGQKVQDAIGKIRENIVVRRIARYEVGA
jgi:elongation factor Ts